MNFCLFIALFLADITVQSEEHSYIVSYKFNFYVKILSSALQKQSNTLSEVAKEKQGNNCRKCYCISAF